MSDLWIEFDKKVGELESKASNLEQLKGKLAAIPQRLQNVKAKTEALVKNAKETVTATLKKDMAQKVANLDKILTRINTTESELSGKTATDLEGAIKALEDYTAGTVAAVAPSAQTQANTPAPTLPASAKPASAFKPPEKTPEQKRGLNPGAKPFTPATKPAAKPGLNPGAKPFTPAAKPGLNPGAKPFVPAGKGTAVKLGGYISNKKYSQKRKHHKKHKSHKKSSSKKSHKKHKKTKRKTIKSRK